MTSDDRIRCCVPFCRRTAARARFPDAVEVICGKHWRLASATLRRRLSRLRRLTRRLVDEAALARAARLDWTLWGRIKAQVIERAAGL